MAWVFLGIAGLMEVFWATCLKLSEGFTKLGFSALTIVGMLVSFGLLSQAMKTLPLGTAYGIWTGIGHWALWLWDWCCLRSLPPPDACFSPRCC